MATMTEEAGAIDMDEIENMIVTRIDAVIAKSGGALQIATSTIVAEIATNGPDTTLTTAARAAVEAAATAAMVATADHRTATGSLMCRGTTKTITATIKTTKTSCFRSRTG